MRFRTLMWWLKVRNRFSFLRYVRRLFPFHWCNKCGQVYCLKLRWPEYVRSGRPDYCSRRCAIGDCPPIPDWEKKKADAFWG